LTNPQPDEQGRTTPVELPGHQPPPSPSPQAPRDEVSRENPASSPATDTTESREPTSPVTDGAAVRAPSPGQPAITFVPMAVTIGDGFKFGCGFFLATVLAALIAFVLLAALFVLTGLFGLNLPLTR
jgi:hypothetical protein